MKAGILFKIKMSFQGLLSKGINQDNLSWQAGGKGIRFATSG